jgi:nickel-dependent lactate racemase
MMKTVTIPFHGKPLSFEIRDDHLLEVLTPRKTAPIKDLETALVNALANPLGQGPLQEWVKPTDRILILSDDNTRLTPAERLLPPLIRTLNEAGVPDHRISILMALGTHRPMTEQEMINKVGPEVFSRIEVFNHDWKNADQLVDMGQSKHGTPLHVNRAILDADVLIGLGSIVPHHIPGFSGSSKIVQPGVCGAVTTAETHLMATRVEDSLLGLEDNLVRQDMDDMAERVGMRTILNVVLDSDGLVTGIFFGDMRMAFAKGVELAKAVYGIPYQTSPDIVMANSCPCDIDFWQSHKSLYPAARMVKKGGTIIIVTPAPEGVSQVHTDLLDYASWSSTDIEKAYRNGKIKSGVAAALAVAWAKVREKASVIMVSPGISAEEKGRLGFTHAPDIGSALKEAFARHGSHARVSILTHAPDMLPIKAF